MKILKKTLNIFLVAVLITASFVTPVSKVQAKTLGDMKKELQAQQDAYDKKKEEKELTEEEKEKTQANIESNKQKIVQLKNESSTLDDEITELNKSMQSKYAEINQILNYVQISNGESSYLQYIFGAKTFTDFIYRASIAEQLSKYNKELIDEYNDDIKQSKEKQAEIDKKQDEIATIQVELNEQSTALGEKVASLTDDMSDEEDNLKLLKSNILDLQNTYQCSDTEDISACKQRALASTYIPPSTGAFKRPIVNAVVTANFGYYNPFGYTTWHAAMDLAGDPGSKIYAAADGKVVEVKHQSCGNHIVYIVHNINGVRYTTGYWHMRTTYVSVGQLVTSNTVIGIQGGLSSEDSCSTGQHLDFVVTRGAYKLDYFTNPRSVSMDPRNVLSFPPLQVRSGCIGIGTSKEWTTR